MHHDIVGREKASCVFVPDAIVVEVGKRLHRAVGEERSGLVKATTSNQIRQIMEVSP